MKRLRFTWPVRALGLLIVAAAMAGCQSSSPVLTHALIEHQASVDFHGLQSTRALPAVNVLWAAPRDWNALPIESNPLFTHQQWHSPTNSTGVGIVFIHVPLPLTVSAVLWLAERHFNAMPSEKGHLLGEWTDALHRSWFEAENPKYRVRGYVITRGTEAWIVYFGYKTTNQLNMREISVATRSVETIVPMSGTSWLDRPKEAAALGPDDSTTGEGE